MNWYKDTTTKYMKKQIQEAIAASSEKMVKYAEKVDLAHPIFTDKGTPATNQTGNFFEMYDIQRYVFDSYAIKTSFSQTNAKFAISVTTTHDFLGTITWDEYWFYPLNQYDKAKETYDRLNKVVAEITTQFVEAGGDLPTPMFWTFLKAAAEKIDPKATTRSNIPYVNFAKQYAHLSNPDWRMNLYGGRYPKYVEESFNSYAEYRKKLWGK